MAGILTFDEYIGGNESVIIEKTVPSTQEILTLNFGESVSGWSWEVDTQTLIVDKLAYDRNTGDPNFANSKVVGYFAKTELTPNTLVSVVNQSTGVVKLTRPSGLYTGPVIPDARQNVPVSIFSFSYTNALGEKDTMRFVYIQCWEPDVAPTDPTLAVGYTALTLGA